MVLYHGGKKQYGHKIAETIVSLLPTDRKFTVYCEPFCGMLGVFRHIIMKTTPSLFQSYFAGDLHASVIAMWQAVQHGWLPPEDGEQLLTQEMFEKLDRQSSPGPLKAYVGFGFSYGGQFFQGKLNASQSRHRKYLLEFQELFKLFTQRQIQFQHGNYLQCSLLTDAVIYVDPPYYKKANKYRDENKKWFPKFDHVKFWDWVREMSYGNIVFVSEQTYPDDFVAVGAFTRTQNIHPEKRSSQLDYLVVHKSLIPHLRMENIDIVQ